MALDTTVGGSSSESYVTVATFDTYIETVYPDVTQATTVLDLETAAKEHRLKIAALVMNLYPWRWEDEHDFIKDDEDYYLDFSDITANVPSTPSEITYAQMEIAYQVIDYVMSLDPMAFPEREISRFELGGSLAIEFFANRDGPSMSKIRASSLDIILAYCGKWYKRFSGGAV